MMKAFLFIGIFLSNQVLAQDYNAAVDAEIKASFELAKADAEQFAANDFNESMKEMMDALVDFSSERPVFKEIQKLLIETEEELVAILNHGFPRESDAEAAIKDLFARFEVQYRNIYHLTWVPNAISAEATISRNTIANIAKKYRDICEKGRSLAAWSYIAPTSLSSPMADSKFDIRVSPNAIGILTHGFFLTFSYGYSSSTAGSEAANRDRSLFVNTVFTASNIATNAYIATKLAGFLHIASVGSGTLATVNAAMVAAAPYLAGLAVITMVVVGEIAKAEAAKMKREMEAALHRRNMKVADGETVNEFYRASCKAYGKALDHVVQTLNDINDPMKLAAEMEKARAMTPVVQAWKEESRAVAVAHCAMAVSARYAQHGCTKINDSSEFVNLKPRSNVPKSLCIIDPKDEMIVPVDGSCGVAKDDEKRKDQVAQAKAKIDAYVRSYSPQFYADLISTRVVSQIANQKIFVQYWKDQSQRMMKLVEREILNQARRSAQAQRPSTLAHNFWE